MPILLVPKLRKFSLLFLPLLLLLHLLLSVPFLPAQLQFFQMGTWRALSMPRVLNPFYSTLALVKYAPLGSNVSSPGPTFFILTRTA